MANLLVSRSELPELGFLSGEHIMIPSVQISSSQEVWQWQFPCCNSFLLELVSNNSSFTTLESTYVPPAFVGNLGFFSLSRPISQDLSKCYACLFFLHQVYGKHSLNVCPKLQENPAQDSLLSAFKFMSQLQPLQSARLHLPSHLQANPLS